MGKIIQKKKESVFKVAGAKSLKAKKKAKQFTGNFKKIKETNRKNIDQLDKTLVNLENDLRREKKRKEEKVIRKDWKEEKKLAKDLEKEKDEALEKLNEMRF